MFQIMLQELGSTVENVIQIFSFMNLRTIVENISDYLVQELGIIVENLIKLMVPEL